MPKTLPRFMSELPAAPEYNPVRKAIERTGDAEAAEALRLFASMPPSTAVLANPVRYRRSIPVNDETLNISIRSFGIRGCLLEEDIVAGSADAFRVIFVGLFGRFASANERRVFASWLSRQFNDAVEATLPQVARFMGAFPKAPADSCMQHLSSIRKATNNLRAINGSRPPGELLEDLLRIHLENVTAGACASYMRFLLSRGRQKAGEAMLRRNTKRFLEYVGSANPFHAVFSLLLRRRVTPTEARILENNGTIQIHHGSAGSNMVARYMATLHTRSVSDLFCAAQMALDGARHFGAIHDLTDFVGELENASPCLRDDLIRARGVAGNLPVFGHPEIAAAGRTGRIELDPRPAIYLAPLFDAIDKGCFHLSARQLKRICLVQRMYQIAFVEGIEKPGRPGRLRIAPNTDFGTWILQEVLGIEDVDRTLLSYVFRGFGWMMDVREQLQQPIIRPVIPPDPSVFPPPVNEGVIGDTVGAVHDRLCRPNAFTPSS